MKHERQTDASDGASRDGLAAVAIIILTVVAIVLVVRALI